MRKIKFDVILLIVGIVFTSIISLLVSFETVADRLMLLFGTILFFVSLFVEYRVNQ